jgi:catechol 2,3-dioxygenase-like lactoylglutathione lyase family enzyme
MRHVTITVRDLDRSTAFYSELLELPVVRDSVDADGHPNRWLAAGPGLVRLVEVGASATPTTWDRDDLQRGIRHFGLKVRDVDEWYSRLRAAGVEFAVDPTDALGDVRLAFFFDPDGAYLEIVAGDLNYDPVWSADLVAEEIASYDGWDGKPRFDHVAVTVPSLDEARQHYRDFGVAGQLLHGGDRDFVITYFRAANATLEVFSYGAPTFGRDGMGELGIQAIGLSAPISDGDGAPFEVIQ